MDSELIPLNFNKILQSRSYTTIILGNEHKRFAIYMEPRVGEYIQTFLADDSPPRPYTYDLFNSILHELDVKILQVVVTDIEDTIYFTRLFLEQVIGDERRILEVDSRPSDCIPLAIMNNIPLFCRKEIFEKTLAIEEEA
ncbi:MAG: bifunctional nuclease domain-containing protein [Chlamydiota bacterium]